MVRDWSEDEAEEDASAYMLNPWKRRSEQTMQGGIDPTSKGAVGGPDARREDSGKGNQAATTRRRPGFLRPADKPRANAASRLHHHS
jgi:hypothetical protein